MSESNNTPFRIVRGGLSDSADSSSKEFISAYVTDTRLMGVIGLHIHWKLPQNINARNLHQFFYFDCEEFGFDTYKSLITDSSEDAAAEVESAGNELLGGLGGSKIPVSEREARYLVQQYVMLNQREGLPLPEEYSEYSFLLKPTIRLTESEEYILMGKQCTKIVSPYQVITYFLMRCFGRDFSAAKYLTKNYVRTDLFPEHKGATLLRNAIDEAKDEKSGSNTDYYATDDDNKFGTFKTHKSYICESLIEYSNMYFIIVTQVTLDHLRVVKYERISSFRISAAETAMISAKPEYITVIDILDGAPTFEKDDTVLSQSAMVTEHDGGRLFMMFYPHNDHVCKKIYQLNDDVLGVYYVVENDQIVAAAYDSKNIQLIEDNLMSSYYNRYLLPVSKYQFKEPVLYDFINSGFEDFEDFVFEISNPDDDE